MGVVVVAMWGLLLTGGGLLLLGIYLEYQNRVEEIERDLRWQAMMHERIWDEHETR